MWNDEQKTQFICFAFQECHSTCRAIRERLYSIVNYSVTLFLVVSAFFLTQTPSLPSHVKQLTVIGVLLMICISISLLNRAYANLQTMQSMLAALETEMDFHTIDAYASTSGALLGSATVKKLIGHSYYRRTMWLYRITVILIGFFAVVTILLTQQLQLCK